MQDLHPKVRDQEPLLNALMQGFHQGTPMSGSALSITVEREPSLQEKPKRETKTDPKMYRKRDAIMIFENIQ